MADNTLSRELNRVLSERKPWTVLTGAGCSTASGLPAYRDAEGQWRHRKPMTIQEFLANDEARQRYWIRSMAGWPRFAAARPCAAHLALARLRREGLLGTLITQNVDGLHGATHYGVSDTKGRTGHSTAFPGTTATARLDADVVELHGRLSEVSCHRCAAVWSRQEYQQALEELNGPLVAQHSVLKPDGDLELAPRSTAFKLADCHNCGGIVRPNVVFFGERVPEETMTRALSAVCQGQGLLVVASSLAVHSGMRLVREAEARSHPIVLINRGHSRAEKVARYTADGDVNAILPALCELRS